MLQEALLIGLDVAIGLGLREFVGLGEDRPWRVLEAHHRLRSEVREDALPLRACRFAP